MLKKCAIPMYSDQYLTVEVGKFPVDIFTPGIAAKANDTDCTIIMVNECKAYLLDKDLFIFPPGISGLALVYRSYHHTKQLALLNSCAVLCNWEYLLGVFKGNNVLTVAPIAGLEKFIYG